MKLVTRGQCTVACMSDPSLDDIISRLENIGETLGERSMTLLRDAIEKGETARPPEERVVAQARRAVDKAVSLLSGISPRND